MAWFISLFIVAALSGWAFGVSAFSYAFVVALLFPLIVSMRLERAA